MRSKLYSVLLMIFLIASISASIQVGNLSHKIETSYGIEDNLKGWINISVEDENSNLLITSNYEDLISLIDLLELNSITDYTCIPSDCKSNYEAKTEKTSLSLTAGQEKILGLKFTGIIDDITSISFKVQSNAVASCTNQLKIDILNNNEIDFSNNKSSTADCNDFKSYSCYNSSSSSSESILGETPYCQKFNLRESPSLKAGTWIKKESGDKEVKMSMYNSDGEKMSECSLASTEITSSGSEVSCLMDRQILTQGEYYLCVSALGSGTYKIKKNSVPTSNCGFYGQPVKNSVTAYSIFTIPKAFDNLGTLEITNNLQNQETFSGLALQYLADKYGYSMDCSDSCILPIKLTSTKDQQLTFSNIEATYITEQGIEQETKLYELEETPSKLSFNFTKLILDEAGFSLPDDFGNHTFKLEFNNEKIFEDKITISKIPVIEYVTPLATSTALPTEFKAFVSSDSNISNYIWEFGDGISNATTINKITHTFNETKAYELKLTIVDIQGKNSSKLFTISVGVPRDAANQTLKEKDQFLKNITTQINSYHEFIKQQLKSALDLDEKESQIKSLTTKYASAVNDEDYIKIMEQLVELKIPESIVKTKTASDLVYLPHEENIDISRLADLSSNDYSSSQEEEYIQGVYAWHQKNLETKLSYNEFSAIYPHTSEKLLNTFTFNIKLKNSPSYDVYFIIDNLEDLEFNTNSGLTERETYTYIKLKDEQTITFSTTEDVLFNSLPAFISPSLNRLDVSIEIPPICNANGKCDEGENWRNCPDDCSPLFWIFLIVFFLVFIFLTLYIILQEWYKRSYETHLFKNRTYLFNIVNFINNSKTKGMTESEISNKLKKAGWTSEQVSYAMKKYQGKRTGMFEIPVEKVLKIFRRKNTHQEIPKNPGFAKDINNYRKFNKGF